MYTVCFRSGTDEEYTERDVLLTDVDEMEREAAKCKEEKKGAQSAEKQKEEQGKEIREAAMQSLKRSGEFLVKFKKNEMTNIDTRISENTCYTKWLTLKTLFHCDSKELRL